MDSRRVNTQIEERQKFNITPKNMNSNMDCSELLKCHYDESNIGTSEDEENNVEKNYFYMDSLNQAIKLWISTFETEIGPQVNIQNLDDGTILYLITNLICDSDEEPINNSEIMKFREIVAKLNVCFK